MPRRKQPDTTRTYAIESRCRGFRFACSLNTNAANRGSSGWANKNEGGLATMSSSSSSKAAGPSPPPPPPPEEEEEEEVERCFVATLCAAPEDKPRSFLGLGRAAMLRKSSRKGATPASVMAEPKKTAVCSPLRSLAGSSAGVSSRIISRSSRTSSARSPSTAASAARTASSSDASTRRVPSFFFPLAAAPPEDDDDDAP
mmetsp:Transcript_23912/g.94868  ORF Transcript_23912/g.94868 Transcript_23912/m.94868 type:complete len:200 (+) Transcript_23912:896-1495(+)